MNNTIKHQDSFNRGGLGVRVLLIVGGLVAIGAVLWVLLLPNFVAAKIRKQTGFAVKVDRLAVNPLTANVAVSGLVLKNPPGWPVEDFVDLREFRAKSSLFSLMGERLEADEVVVDMERLTLVKNQQGQLNAVAFKDALAGDEAKSKPAEPQKKFLIRHLVMKFDKLVYADHSTGRPNVREYNLNVNRDMRDVDSVGKLISPFSGAVLGVMTDTLGGMFAENPDLLKDLKGTLQDAGKTTGEKLKGLLDSLDKKKP
jgi:hypothetical protein